MCGIMGCVGGMGAVEVVTSGLRLLEYRGYDSSGIAAIRNASIHVRKKKGRVSTLLSSLTPADREGSPCIGHVRWATHGDPDDKNAHPFLSYRKLFALAHNGVVENHLELKDFLLKSGVVFSSDTDSEVIVNLIDYLFKGDPFSALLGAVSLLKGSFAIALISPLLPDRIYFAKKQNPLVVGVENGRGYVCSDVPSISSYLSECVVLPDRTLGYVTDREVFLASFDGNFVLPVFSPLSRTADHSLGAYAHYMRKEIDEIPDAVARSLRSFPSELPFTLSVSLRRVVFLGCGTALHACMVAVRFLRETFPSLDGYAVSAGELLSETFPIRDTLFVAVSQSGETADTVNAVKQIRAQGGFVLAICNVEASSLVREADRTFLTEAGAEISVASTKAYNAQVAVLYALCLRVVRLFRPDAPLPDEAYLLSSLPILLRAVLTVEDEVAAFARRTLRVSGVYYVGRSFDFYVACEGSLKLKEISYVPSEAFAAGELKHGSLALIDDRSLVVAIATQTAVFDKMATCLAEVRSRGASVLLVTNAPTERFAGLADCLIRIPEFDDRFSPILSVVPLQLFAYHAALCRGLDIDKPRNLAKSVTVE